MTLLWIVLGSCILVFCVQVYLEYYKYKSLSTKSDKYKIALGVKKQEYDKYKQAERDLETALRKYKN